MSGNLGYISFLIPFIIKSNLILKLNNELMTAKTVYVLVSEGIC